jgi:lysophospholipase L1-like esterase
MPRRIVMEQVTNFMVLSDGFPKIPIKIVINQDSAEQYAHDIRQMFDCANFPKPPDADTWGISRNMEYRITLKFKYTNDAPDVFFVTYGTNDVFNILNHVQVSGRYIFPDTNQMTVYSAIKDCFKKIGINSVWHSSDFLVKTGECCILVLPKQF